MNDKKEIIIRKETPADWKQTEYMTMKAFWNLHNPGCNEQLLVHKVRESEIYLPELSRVAECDGKIVGTIMYTIATIIVDNSTTIGAQLSNAVQPRLMTQSATTTHKILTFGPLCVDPAYQNYGVGGKLLKTTMQLAKDAGYGAIIIFGEPDYYPKHGFVTCDHFGITTMDGKNFDPFMGIELIPGYLSDKKGKFAEGEVFEHLTEEENEELTTKLGQQFGILPKVAMPSQWTYDNASIEKNGYQAVDAVQKKREFFELSHRYIREMTAYNPWLAEQYEKDSDFLPEDFDEYFAAPRKKPLVLFAQRPVGIAVVSGPGEEDLDDGCMSYMEELFVLPEYRGKGIATDFVSRFLRQQTGAVGFCVLKKNVKALELWEGLLQKENYSYELIDADDVWFVKVQC